MLLKCIRESLEGASRRRAISLDLQMSEINSNHQQFSPRLAEVFFTCRYYTAPSIHPAYYNQNQDNSIGHQLKVVMGCLLLGRSCINSPLYNLPQKTHLRLLSYYMDRCTEQIDQLMQLDSPPLTLSLSLLTLAVTHVNLMDARKGWLLMATARAYLHNHMDDYFDAIMDKTGPTNPELETYKLMLLLCGKADVNISYLVQNGPAQSIFSFDEMLLVPKPVIGDNPLHHAIVKQSFLFDLMARRSNSRIDSSIQCSNSIRTAKWKAITQTNSDFTAWYIGLPSELKIGDKPFDIVNMEIPEDLDTSIACLQLTYYSEWVWVYGNVYNPDTSSNPSKDEATFLESTHMIFLASLSMVKVSEFLHKVEMCKIEYHRLLFACEPLLYLAKSTDSHIAYESEKALKKAVSILKSLLQHNLFSPICKVHQENGNSIAFGQRLIGRLNALFSEYNMQF
ncbi:hypothetical protein K450DRAFT_291109 [Umbelopsis ramanniana AG]|uniref:Transcription factor domain-containing protein n=1 Tax=Umbelopsis ramanniana AG TaxID=1314678 RepID=A0AAD5EG09_UMBRA|nr:uncharacterized protein K450DRAFT_291109 [Umbelopsis ramanniana AG]KAI8583043.1 hypothetical protein K450DRAFT_291109 [Umbelopsis ramanniana AG]